MASSISQLKADLANAKNRAKNALDKLNAVVASNKQKNLPSRKGADYEAANQTFEDAGKEVGRLEKALTEFKEPEKVKTKSQLSQEEETLRQKDILAGKDPVVEAKARADKKAADEKAATLAEEQKTNPDVATEDFSKEFTQTLADSGRYIAGLSDSGRIQLAKSLNNIYGLKIATNGKYSKELKDAYVKALSDNYTRSLDFNQKMSLPEFLVVAEKEGTYKPGGSGGDKGPTSFQELSDPTTAASTINSVVKSLLNRDATSKEVLELTKILNDAERKSPRKYDSKTGKSVTGLNQVQFITDLIKSGKYADKTLGKLKSVGKLATELATKKTDVKTINGQSLMQTAKDNGITLSQDQLDVYTNEIQNGKDISVIKSQIRTAAGLGMPDNVKKLLADGTDLSTVYAPYKSLMYQILEVNPDAINLNDPTLRMAIGPDKEMSIYDFQNALRKDVRWQYTNNAKESVSSSVQKVLRDFGFMG